MEYENFVEELVESKQAYQFAERVYNDYAKMHYPKLRIPVEQKTIGNFLAALIEALPRDARAIFADIAVNWAELVGEVNARESHPVGLVNKILEVETNDAQYAKALDMWRDAILEKVQNLVGRENVVDIKFHGSNAAAGS
ncbi:MAG: DUF721 domain-containing protein [Bifidobacteriaceae bacterium]|jgi:hypothetical protein|nr:DUF721 domain-containing protein [Bifidobacteriaceae bacterium]